MLESVNLEKYRKPADLEHHWLLKKSFIERYINDFPEDKLLCLAQLCVNVETLGVGYSEEVMQELNRLSADVPYIQDFRNAKETMDRDKAVIKKDMKKKRHLSRPQDSPYRQRESYYNSQNYHNRKNSRNTRPYDNHSRSYGGHYSGNDNRCGPGTGWRSSSNYPSNTSGYGQRGWTYTHNQPSSGSYHNQPSSGPYHIQPSSGPYHNRNYDSRYTPNYNAPSPKPNWVRNQTPNYQGEGYSQNYSSNLIRNPRGPPAYPSPYRQPSVDNIRFSGNFRRPSPRS